MCRYAQKIYKFHFVCFKCRKGFKQTNPNDILLNFKSDKIYSNLNGKSIGKITTFTKKSEKEKLKELKHEISLRKIKCPECSNIMANLGLDFKAPKKSAKKEWKIIEGLYKIGKSFFSCGCDGIGYIPINKNDYRSYLVSITEDYNKNIYYYKNKSLEECSEKLERIQYWVQKLKVIEIEIQLLININKNHQ